jgi:hypothetical protein
MVGVEEFIENGKMKQSLLEFLLKNEKAKLGKLFTSAIFITLYMLIASLSMGFAKLAKK